MSKKSKAEKLAAEKFGLTNPKPESKLVTKKGWFFATDDNRLRYGDGRLVTVGETHETSHDIALCHGGMHASSTVLHGLNYAYGKNLYRVSVDCVDENKIGVTFWETFMYTGDKFVGTARTYLAHIDPSDIFDKKVKTLLLKNIPKGTNPKQEVLDYLNELVPFPETLIANDLNNFEERNFLETVWRVHQAKITEQGFSKMAIYNSLFQTLRLNDASKDLDAEILEAMNLKE